MKKANEFELRFSADLTPEDVRFAIAALADYWRACGGVGLKIVRFAVVAAMFAVSFAATRPVNLAWDANTEADLAGYNVYRATGPGAFARINFSTVTEPAYSDATAEIGKTYRYHVTALNTSNLESGPSNIVTIFVGNANPPSAPTGLTVSGLGSTAELRWDWNESADSYRVEYAKGNEPVGWLSLGETRENRVSHKTGGPRWYRVVSIAGDRESQPSKAVYYHP